MGELCDFGLAGHGVLLQVQYPGAVVGDSRHERVTVGPGGDIDVWPVAAVFYRVLDEGLDDPNPLRFCR